MPAVFPKEQFKKRIQFSPKVRVMIVDGDCPDLEYCSHVLSQRGYEILSLQSYDEAVRRLGREPFDFVMVCQGGPTFEGRSVLERVVEVDRKIPVLVLTRCPEMQCYLEAMQLGAIDYVEKPISPPEMLRLVETHLRPRTAAA